MNKEKVFQYLGLCKRANKMVTGETPVVEYIRSKSVFLVIMATDTGYRTSKKITDKSRYYEIDLVHKFTTDELNQAIGTRNRKVIGITDKHFSEMIKQQLEE